MVYAFTLPTTSHLSFQSFLSSSTHPSLPQSASTARHALRAALKAHKRLPRGAQRDSHLSTVITAASDYLPYLQAISAGLSGSPSLQSEPIAVAQHSDFECEWRPTLSSPAILPSLLRARPSRSSPSSSSGRLRLPGLDAEIAFVISTLAYALSNLAHSTVTRSLYAPTTPTPEQRTAAIQTATKHLLQASALHASLAASPSAGGSRAFLSVPDLNPGTQSALSSLALAEATLLAVLKDDSYVAACIQARNPNDKDWMVRAPEIPKVRAHLFARLCLRAAEYADQSAAAMGAVGGGGQGRAALDDELLRYVRVLGRVARARACRFFGVDAELAGKIGEGIAWLRAARGRWRWGLGDGQDGGKSRGLSKLKQGWMERREERRMEKDAGGRSVEKLEKGDLGPGDQAGREEEGRVLEMLEVKWVRMNDTINTQLIPPSADLLANLPSGRDIHSAPAPYKLPSLDEDRLAGMRAPPAEDDFAPGSDVEDSDEESPRENAHAFTPGGLPERSESTSTYY
ncbi:hypothetical protein P170DRAFT_425274 [Aspergillus steynii IBT 23096]|uniref:pH-response regulator protein palC n=1 Tax=Aspergillus steynii IBT 23096 TaxID=1392250 RepID=A0A2I2GDS2_9EURO|nr:uncharacterized protein P170DRAFT_425274 [Aspergillus steynii IBT 23096]PLB50981.1 hypothetical protein P170DRAFT_425274 [Aspergillus steynii IBT 23096]